MTPNISAGKTRGYPFVGWFGHPTVPSVKHEVVTNNDNPRHSMQSLFAYIWVNTGYMERVGIRLYKSTVAILIEYWSELCWNRTKGESLALQQRTFIMQNWSIQYQSKAI